MRGTIAIAVIVIVTGCSSDPADVAGSYTVAVTNRENGCNLSNWTVDASTPNIPVTITQDGGDAIASVDGVIGIFVQGALGSRTFYGTVSGSHLDLELIGTNPMTSGNCTFTYNGIIDGAIDGDVIQGDITYAAQTNGQPDCATIEGCESRQDFNGTRPPT